MHRKLLTVIIMCVLMLAFAACGEDEDDIATSSQSSATGGSSSSASGGGSSESSSSSSSSLAPSVPAFTGADFTGAEGAYLGSALNGAPTATAADSGINVKFAATLGDYKSPPSAMWINGTTEADVAAFSTAGGLLDNAGRPELAFWISGDSGSKGFMLILGDDGSSASFTSEKPGYIFSGVFPVGAAALSVSGTTALGGTAGVKTANNGIEWQKIILTLPAGYATLGKALTIKLAGGSQYLLYIDDFAFQAAGYTE